MADKSVNQIILTQEENAADAIQRGEDFLNNLSELANSTTFDDVTLPTIWNYTIFGDSESALDDAKSNKPKAPDIPELAIVLPTDITIPDVVVGTVTIPTFTAAKPTINIPTTPSVSLPAEPSSPELLTATLPDKQRRVIRAR